MTIPVQSYRKWVKVLKNGGAVYYGQDSKNHHVWAYTPTGTTQPVTAGIAAHSMGAEVKPVYMRKLRQAWFLREEDGVSDSDFLAGKWS